jgi:hypothetical protein
LSIDDDGKHAEVVKDEHYNWRETVRQKDRFIYLGCGMDAADDVNVFKYYPVLPQTRVIHPPTSVPMNVINNAKTGIVIPSIPTLAFDALKLDTAAVAIVYSDPANDVTCPAPLVASVIACPPTEVTTVTALPPIAVIRVGFITCFSPLLVKEALLTGYSLEHSSTR